MFLEQLCIFMSIRIRILENTLVTSPDTGFVARGRSGRWPLSRHRPQRWRGTPRGPPPCTRGATPGQWGGGRLGPGSADSCWFQAASMAPVCTGRFWSCLAEEKKYINASALWCLCCFKQRLQVIHVYRTKYKGVMCIIILLVSTNTHKMSQMT